MHGEVRGMEEGQVHGEVGAGAWRGGIGLDGKTLPTAS